MTDLALLVADHNMKFAMMGILGRLQSLRIRSITYEIRTHGGHDGGARVTGPETLAQLKRECRCGILMLDWEGSGASADSTLALEHELDQRLVRTWGDQSKAIVIEPELDAWAWGSDNAMSGVLGWTEDRKIRDWLTEQGHVLEENQKPVRPKEAFTRLMEELKQPRSSSVYQKLAGRISLDRCVDPAFVRLKTILQTWFPVDQSPSSGD